MCVCVFVCVKWCLGPVLQNRQLASECSVVKAAHSHEYWFHVLKFPRIQNHAMLLILNYKFPFQRKRLWVNFSKQVHEQIKTRNNGNKKPTQNVLAPIYWLVIFSIFFGISRAVIYSNHRSC